jgi:hypothetical protein
MDKLLAALTLAICAVLLARLMIGEVRRQRVDAIARRAWSALTRRVFLMWHWRGAKRAAAREAEDAIRRARRKDGGGEWDGNVYKPKSFRKPPNKLH